MASIETSQHDNRDTVVSILKEIRDILRHQEKRIQNLENKQTPPLLDKSLKLSKEEKGKQQDSQLNENIDETGGSTQPLEGRTGMRLPSQHLGEVASTSSQPSPQPQSNSGQQEITISHAEPPASEVRNECNIICRLYDWLTYDLNSNSI